MPDVKFTSNRSAVLAAVKDANARALEIMGGKAESYAKQLAPVDTGNLRNSITHQQIDDSTEVIATPVEYAPYQELGTRYIKPHPFLRPAAEDHASEYKAIWEGELGKIT
jgi:HK97 gp10 family phage protein